MVIVEEEEWYSIPGLEILPPRGSRDGGREQFSESVDCVVRPPASSCGLR